MLEKPSSISDNPFKSQKWDEITEGRDFQASDIPQLVLLCQWYAVIDQCVNDLDYNGEIRVAYQNDIGDIKAFPQIATMKQASAEIRALNKQLGINDEVTPKEEKPKRSPLNVIQFNRQARSKNRSAG